MSPGTSRTGRPSPRASFGVVLAGFTIGVAAPVLGHDRLVLWIGAATALAITLIFDAVGVPARFNRYASADHTLSINLISQELATVDDASSPIRDPFLRHRTRCFR